MSLRKIVSDPHIFSVFFFSYRQSFHPELDRSALEHKIKLLTIASLGHANVGKDVPYSTIASAIHAEPSAIENWTIDCIRSGLITARISQTKQSVRILRATTRAFEREQWEALEQRLLSWKTGLVDVLEVVAGARRQGASYPSAPQAVTT
jgi:translation initiation factor 3 subunit M